MVVDGLQRATRDELFDALVLPRNARHGLVGKKMTPKLVGERVGLRLVSLRGRLGVPVHHVALGRVELLDGESESARPLDLGCQQTCRLDRILPGNGSGGDKRLVAPNDRRSLRLRGQEGAYGPVGELVQAHAEHPVDQLVFEQRLVGANGGQRRLRPQVLGEVDVAGWQLGLRDDERVKRRPRRDLEARRSGPRVRDRRHIGEQRLDAAFDLVDVDITHDNHGLEIGAVPVAIEPAQHVGRHRTQAAFGADRESGGVAAPVEHPQQHLPPYPLLGGVAAAQFRQHDTTLGLDIRIGEQGVAGPLPQDGEASLEHFAIADRNREHVDRLVVPRGRVEIAAEPHPHRLQVRDELVFRETARAVERHVFDEMRRAELVIVFEDRPRVDDQPQLGTALRAPIGPDVVRQPVWEPAFADLAYERDRRRSRRLRLRRRRAKSDRAEQQGKKGRTETPVEWEHAHFHQTIANACRTGY